MNFNQRGNMKLLQTALEAIEVLTTDNTSEDALAHAASARIKLMNALSPALYQYRMRPVWLTPYAWTAWEDCSEEASANYAKLKIYHDWEYQTRKLYED